MTTLNINFWTPTENNLHITHTNQLRKLILFLFFLSFVEYSKDQLYALFADRRVTSNSPPFHDFLLEQWQIDNYKYPLSNFFPFNLHLVYTFLSYPLKFTSFNFQELVFLLVMSHYDQQEVPGKNLTILLNYKCLSSICWFPKYYCSTLCYLLLFPPGKLRIFFTISFEKFSFGTYIYIMIKDNLLILCIKCLVIYKIKIKKEFMVQIINNIIGLPFKNKVNLAIIR